MPPQTITRKELNRATLARQYLLRRENTTAVQAIERLIGMQAQEARPPFIGLWSRLESFTRDDLTRLLMDRSVVRATAMRGTLHLMTAADYGSLRATLQPALTLGMQSVLRQRVDGLDVADVVARGRAFFSAAPATFDDLRVSLAQADPNCDERALAYVVRTHLPLALVPEDTLWGYPAAARFTPADLWLGAAPDDAEKPDELARRYLAAFGPATAADIQAWSGMKGFKEVLDGLRPELRTFRDERKRELFDLPDAPLPGADTEAPIRFLPEYDNILLAHADRSRIISDEHRKRVVTPNLRVLATFLVDGFVAGLWSIERRKKAATLVLKPFHPLPQSAQDDLIAEGHRLLRFSEEGMQSFDVRIQDDEEAQDDGEKSEREES
jgi:hypothetical protein